jgi:hypothetical protein
MTKTSEYPLKTKRIVIGTSLCAMDAVAGTVDCFLGFSYDGPRAWEVRNV